VKRAGASAALAILWLAAGSARAGSEPASTRFPRRLVILKIDGLNGGLLQRYMRTIDPATGKPELPWLAHIFGENGTVFENFYSRGISLSAPSWSILDTGHHAVIRGNVEFDRFTGQVYDYLNFFPFYLGYARKHAIDMPGVEVLDRAGIPLLIDRFPYARRFQRFELFQRGGRWTTLEDALKRRFSSRALLSGIEGEGAPSMDEELLSETEIELERALQDPRILFLDYFTGDIDHTGHATNDPAALLLALKRLDAAAGRIWAAIERSPLRDHTILAAVSDHGMNNVPGTISQTFNLPDLFNSPAGGAHHVVTDRYELTDFTLHGLNPLVHRVITPSTASFYLQGQADRYPTAWLDIDGNERASVQFRNSDLNKLHILLLQLANPSLPQPVRAAAAQCVVQTIDRHRTAWMSTVKEMSQEMAALGAAIAKRKEVVAAQPKKWTQQQKDRGEDKAAARLAGELAAWQREHAAYTNYLSHLEALLAFRPDPVQPLKQKISDLIPEMALGDRNTVYDLQHYVAGPAAGGLVLDSRGKLDEERSFRYVNYFQLLAAQRAKNNPQPNLSPKPIDFTAVRLPDGTYDRDHGLQHAYWLYGSEDDQLLILTDAAGNIAVQPVRGLTEDASGKVHWSPQSWRAGLPLHLFEDPELRVAPGTEPGSWLSAWHSEREWMEAIHRCRYSNGVIGITEELGPIADLVPGPEGDNPVLVRYERRRRELVQADLQVFASDHWNFNTRFPNPGGNHGSFFRISTHAVWMLAGSGIPRRTIEEPYDGLNFANTLLALMGQRPPLPDRVVQLTAAPAAINSASNQAGR
jgi:hypothetical protein